ncbi:type IV pilus modification PilV family protein [Neobacillus niacini]|uniref:type IV pilus modification PilV family protein n=1 Tax=Neobacillus niacini TaxID=86668 RepID=UPI00204015B2|nr:prepilin-type N-terminal cleavage/methylation domain-containing protein [Neobacillus niacini]MCM3692243.1 prepilin-type N-terminal cleavage/methylation domain-containing protein [Neobacillus niacini]
MKILKDEKGITLIEVLVSIAILSIVFISIMNLFPQMEKINLQNQDKSQAISTAKEILIQWQKNDETTREKVNNLFTGTPVGGFYTTLEQGGSVRIMIKETPSDNKSLKINLHQITVQILNDNGNVISETYGYVRR